MITGFTAGIAVIIFSSQVKDFLGLKMGAVPPEFLEKWESFARHIGTFNPSAAAIAIGSLLIVVLWPRVTIKLPSPFVAMLLATVAVQLLHLPVETIGSRFGGIPSSLPIPSLPSVQWAQVRELVSPAITIALLAALESLLSAVVADGMIGTRHKSNVELVAQGIANIVSPLFGGIPATGAIARTATNIKAGGRTPVAGIVHALTLMLILLLLGRWAAMIPLASLAAILVVVSYNMSEWRSFRSLLRAPKSDIVVLLATFLLTVFVDLTVAVQVGIIASSLLFMRKMSELTEVEGITSELREQAEEEDPNEISQVRRGVSSISRQIVPEGVEVFEVNGPFFFGAADKLKGVLGELGKSPKVFILRMRNVPSIDATGMHALEQLKDSCRKRGTTLLISEIQPVPRRAIIRARKLQIFGRENFVNSLRAALAKAGELSREPRSPSGALRLSARDR